MLDIVIASGVFGLIGYGALTSVWHRKRRTEKRTIKNIELTGKEWALLASLATYQRKSQVSYISEVIKEHLAGKGKTA
jgi:hypothetical protein